MGGSPWRLHRVSGPALDLGQRLRHRPGGVSLDSPAQRRAADAFVERGLAHPLLGEQLEFSLTVVVPALGRPRLLDRCLAGLADLPLVVVDDGTPDPGVLDAVAARHGARLLRHEVNRGPAAARNTGWLAADSDVIAFVDSDCEVTSGQLKQLSGFFADPRVAAVAPRVSAATTEPGLLARFERARSALDMGEDPQLVRPGGWLAFVPSAVLLVRRSALTAGQVGGFDEQLRLGEDVDLVWRLCAHGWAVRYQPEVVVGHEPRLQPVSWLRRRFEYGTSAPGLARRHAGLLTPARWSAWNLVILAALVSKHRMTAAGLAAASTALLDRRLHALTQDRLVAPRIVGQGLVADAASLGHLLRREWWPVGAACLAGARRSRAARAGALAMLAPVLWEWLVHQPRVDPLRYAGLRLVEDAAYGSGVLVSCVRQREPAPLRPQVRRLWRRVGPPAPPRS